MLAMDKVEAEPDEPDRADIGDGGQPGIAGEIRRLAGTAPISSQLRRPPGGRGAFPYGQGRTSSLCAEHPAAARFDLNPVIARPDGVSAVDARARLSPAEPRDPFLRRLR